MERIIKSIEPPYLTPTLNLVEEVFTQAYNPAEGKLVRRLVEEIRSKPYYLPELELLMTDETDTPLGYAMFSRFPLEGRYEHELLILTPVAVKPEYQRRHISKALLEHGFERAKALGFQAVLVEGNPQNYHARGFRTSADFDILPGPTVHLPHIDCLMVKELSPGALEHIKGTVDYSLYDALRE